MNPCDGPDCGQALENLYLFIDQEIDTASCAEIETHISECTPCLTEYELERVVKALVSRSCSEVAPEPLRAKVLLSIRTVQIQITEHQVTEQKIR